MIRARLKVTGISQMRSKIKQLRKGLPDEVAQALYQETQIEATESKKRTPVLTGNLRASIHVEGPERDYRTVRASIVAGGTAAGYAIYVHENLEAFHKVGQAKFIESVIFESRPYMAARIARRIDLNRAMSA